MLICIILDRQNVVNYSLLLEDTYMIRVDNFPLKIIFRLYVYIYIYVCVCMSAINQTFWVSPIFGKPHIYTFPCISQMCHEVSIAASSPGLTGPRIFCAMMCRGGTWGHDQAIRHGKFVDFNGILKGNTLTIHYRAFIWFSGV